MDKFIHIYVIIGKIYIIEGQQDFCMILFWKLAENPKLQSLKKSIKELERTHARKNSCVLSKMRKLCVCDILCKYSMLAKVFCKKIIF